MLADDIVIDDLNSLTWTLPALTGLNWTYNVVDAGNNREALHLTVLPQLAPPGIIGDPLTPIDFVPPVDAAVSAPPAILLLLSGLAGLAVTGRKRNKQRIH